MKSHSLDEELLAIDGYWKGESVFFSGAVANRLPILQKMVLHSCTVKKH